MRSGPGQAKQKHEAAIYGVRKTGGGNGAGVFYTGETWEPSSVLYKDLVTKSTPSPTPASYEFRTQIQSLPCS